MLFLVVLLAVSYCVHFLGEESWNATSRFLLVYSLGEQGSFRIDSHHQATGDKIYFGGHYYTDKAPGLSAAAVAPFLLFKAAGVAAEKGMRYLLTLSTVGVPSALGAIVFYSLLGLLGWARGRFRVLLTAGWSLGTLAWPFSTVFYGHQPAAVLLLSSFFLLVRNRRRDSWFDAPAAGLLGGAAVLCEYPAALPVLILSAYSLAGRRPWRGLAGWLCGLALPLAALGWYNHHCFGSAWVNGYSYHVTYDHSAGLWGVGIPDLKALWGITFSSYRGVFFQNPFLVFLFPGAWFLLRDPASRLEAGFCVLLCLAQVAFNAGFAYWDGVGSAGARHLVAVLPFAALLVAGTRPSWRPAAALLIVVSIVFMAAMTVTEPRAEWKVSNPLFYFNFYLLGRGLISDNAGTWIGLPPFLSLLPLVAGIGVGLGFLLWRRGALRPTRLQLRNLTGTAVALIVWLATAGWAPASRRSCDMAESYFRYWRTRGNVPWTGVWNKFVAASELDPWYAPPLARLAEIAEAHGDFETALECRSRVLELRGDEEATAALADLYLKMGRPDAAGGLLEELVENNPASGSALRQLAWVRLETGRRQEALELLNRALLLRPGDQLLREGIENLERSAPAPGATAPPLEGPLDQHDPQAF
ncbi:MAG TPA: tetratricopeptide repeat protein [bacterium]|nr:tetratricopeptide repeat protein [bacterium]HPQ65786.1 tetratricopeptide repeat protein [bacterium]